jgi:hypothetical protein
MKGGGAILSSADSCVILQLQWFGQLLPHRGEGVLFWMLLPDSGEQPCDPLPALLQGVAYHLPTLSLHCLSCVYLLWVLCSDSFLWGRISMPLTSSVHVVYSSLFVFPVLQGEISLPRGCTDLCFQETVGESHVVQDSLSHLNPTTLWSWQSWELSK